MKTWKTSRTDVNTFLSRSEGSLSLPILSAFTSASACGACMSLISPHIMQYICGMYSFQVQGRHKVDDKTQKGLSKRQSANSRFTKKPIKRWTLVSSSFLLKTYVRHSIYCLPIFRKKYGFSFQIVERWTAGDCVCVFPYFEIGVRTTQAPHPSPSSCEHIHTYRTLDIIMHAMWNNRYMWNTIFWSFSSTRRQTHAHKSQRK